MVSLESYLIDYLGKFDVVAEKIVESDDKTPDFLIDQEEKVLIELKEKTDDEAKNQKKERSFNNNEIFEYANTSGYRNRLSGIISYGVQQLESRKSETKSQFCFLFIVANGVAPSNQLQQIYSTVYGNKDVIDFGSNSNMAKPCFYAYFSEFYKNHGILDGVFVACNGSVFLFVNSLSVNYPDVLNSNFYSRFVGKIKIVEPLELERSGEILIADCDVPRNNQDKVKQYVFDKYNIKEGLMVDFPHFVYQSRIDLNEI